MPPVGPLLPRLAPVTNDRADTSLLHDPWARNLRFTGMIMLLMRLAEIQSIASGTDAAARKVAGRGDRERKWSTRSWGSVFPFHCRKNVAGRRVGAPCCQEGRRWSSFPSPVPPWSPRCTCGGTGLVPNAGHEEAVDGSYQMPPVNGGGVPSMGRFRGDGQ